MAQRPKAKKGTGIREPRSQRVGREGDEKLNQIVDVLRSRILSRILPPGARLREVELSAEFGVSRTKIRDALAALDKHGLVDRIHNRGAAVKQSGPSNLLELYSIREVLEGLIVRIATTKAEPKSWQDLVQLFGKPTEEAIARGDFATYFNNYETFRRRVADAAQSPTLEMLLRDLYDRTKIAMRRIVVISDRGREALMEHRAVLDAMRKGNAELAETLKRHNVAQGRSYLERYHEYIL